MLRVFVADDSLRVCERLAELISDVEGVKLVGQAQTVGGTIQAIQRLHPDVTILDLGIAGCEGLGALKKMVAGESPLVVIVLAAFPYPQHRRKCLEAGAAYSLDKAIEFEQIAQVLTGLAGDAS